MTNYYETLGVDRSSTLEEIKNAYKNLSLKWHPDKNLNNKEEVEEKFKEINKAYQIISDSELRLSYDDHGEKWQEEFSKNSKQEDKIKRKIKRVISNIISEFNVHWQVTEEDLDYNLWSPYTDWKEKVRSLEINELSSFQEQLINIIQEESEKKQRVLVKKEAIEKINLIKEEAIEKNSLWNR